MIGAGGIFVLLCMWAYTGSFFITVMTLIAIVFSLGISYFMYSLVFELNFFPFMNLLASIVVVGEYDKIHFSTILYMKICKRFFFIIYLLKIKKFFFSDSGRDV